MERGVYILFVIFFLVVFLLGLFFGLGDNSLGQRECRPVKLSYKGWFWKTWEGECATGVAGEGSYIWRFSLCSEEAQTLGREALEEAIKTGGSVILNYRSPLVYRRWEQKSKYCILGVEVR